eukprot:GHRR01029357.1.p1 GENE.GHRR01029357.1~~GHRR01029357.1.p1  ORF type:complete len:119 (+),score=21.45 GHRR01029357.1:457-813(+)
MCKVIENANKGTPSYHQQFQNLKGCKDYDVLKTAHPKPSREAQQKVTGAHRVLFSDVYAKQEQRPLLSIETKEIPSHGGKIKNAVTCFMRFLAITSMHSLALWWGLRCVSVAPAAMAC